MVRKSSGRGAWGIGILATLALPATSLADSFYFNLDVHGFGHDEFRSRGDDVDADIEDLDADLFYLGNEWELVVRYKIEIEDAPIGWCDLVLDVVDPSAQPIRITVPLDRPVDVDDEEVTYKARVPTRIAQEQIRDPWHVRLHAYIIPAGGGPVLDRDATRVRFRQ